MSPSDIPGAETLEDAFLGHWDIAYWMRLGPAERHALRARPAHTLRSARFSTGTGPHSILHDLALEDGCVAEHAFAEKPFTTYFRRRPGDGREIAGTAICAGDGDRFMVRFAVATPGMHLHSNYIQFAQDRIVGLGSMSRGGLYARASTVDSTTEQLFLRRLHTCMYDTHMQYDALQGLPQHVSASLVAAFTREGLPVHQGH